MINITSLYHAVTVEMIGTCAFGININCLQKTKVDTENTIYKAAQVFNDFTAKSMAQSIFTVVMDLFPDTIPFLPEEQCNSKVKNMENG